MEPAEALQRAAQRGVQAMQQAVERELALRVVQQAAVPTLPPDRAQEQVVPDQVERQHGSLARPVAVEVAATLAAVAVV